MKCVALLNQKGGVGKTTSTYNLAAAKAAEGKRVLMIDLDPQASLTIACGIEPGEECLAGHSTVDLFDAKKDPADAVFLVTASGLEGLYIVPSDIDLAETESKLIIKMNSEVKLKRAIEKLEEYFDYIFIDCPPQLGQLAINAMVAADEIVIPCKVDYLSYRGLRALLDTIKQIRDEEMNPDLSISGIIGTFYEARVKDQQDILSMIKERVKVIGTVRKAADISRNVVGGLPVVLALPNSSTAEEYKQIAKEI